MDTPAKIALHLLAAAAEAATTAANPATKDAQ